MTNTHDNIQLHGPLEVALNQACAGYQQWLDAHSDSDDIDPAAYEPIDGVVHHIVETVPLATLGDLRLHAKAFLAWHDGYYGDAPDSLERLLAALEALPERLWNEKIGY